MISVRVSARLTAGPGGGEGGKGPQELALA